MSFSRSDEVDLLTALHEGVHEDSRFATFLARMQRRTRADHVSLIVRQGDVPIHEATQWFAGRDVRAQARQLSELAALDPTPYHRLRPGRVYSSLELIDAEDADHSRFRRDYLERIGVRFGRFMRVNEPDGPSAWLSVTRAADDFTATDSALISSLAPHLTIALRTLTALERACFHAAVADDALARAGIGWAVPGPAGRMLDRGGADDEGTESGAAITIPLARRPLIASTMPERVELTRRRRPPGPGAAAALAAQFALSPGEARLALRLAAGESLAEAAAGQGLTVETARNYSKRLFAKTGTRGQADLVRMVLESAALLN